MVARGAVARAGSEPFRAAGTRRRRLAGARSTLKTTPARFRLAAVLIVAAAAVFGVVAADAATTRREAVEAVARQASPLLVAARLSASLSDADATAASALLIGGPEPLALRRRYLEDLREASRDLTALSSRVERSGPERAAVRLITERLAVYSGLVDTARANNRQGFPVGAAYLRRASGMMRDEILPAAGRLYEIEARRLNGRYRRAASSGAVLEILIAGGVLLAVLAAAQLYVARVTRRILNPALVAASAALVVLLVWLTATFVIAQNALVEAQRKGSDSVEILSVTRILALRARAEELLVLVARGGGAQNVANFKAITGRLGRGDAGGARAGGGLFAAAARVAARSGSARPIDELHTLYGQFLRAHRDVEALERAGRFRSAVRRAVGAGVKASDMLDARLSAQITAAQRRFDASAWDAFSALRGLPFGIPLLTLACAGLALFGLAGRINEYR